MCSVAAIESEGAVKLVFVPLLCLWTLRNERDANMRRPTTELLELLKPCVPKLHTTNPVYSASMRANFFLFGVYSGGREEDHGKGGGAL